MEECLEAVEEGNTFVGGNDSDLVHPIAAFHPSMEMISTVMDMDKQLDGGRQNYSQDLLLDAKKSISVNKNGAEFLMGNSEGKQTDMQNNNQGLLVNAKKSFSEGKNEEETLVGNSQQIVVHGLDGAYLMDKSKWPKLMFLSAKEALDSNNLEVLTQEESLVLQNNEVSSYLNLKKRELLTLVLAKAWVPKRGLPV